MPNKDITQPQGVADTDLDDDIVDLLEVVKPGKPGKAKPPASDDVDFSSDLDAMLESLSKAEQALDANGDQRFPDPTPVDHTVDHNEELTMPSMDDLNSLLESLGADNATHAAEEEEHFGTEASAVTPDLDALPVVKAQNAAPAEDPFFDPDLEAALSQGMRANALSLPNDSGLDLEAELAAPLPSQAAPLPTSEHPAEEAAAPEPGPDFEAVMEAALLAPAESPAPQVTEEDQAKEEEKKEPLDGVNAADRTEAEPDAEDRTEAEPDAEDTPAEPDAPLPDLEPAFHPLAEADAETETTPPSAPEAADAPPGDPAAEPAPIRVTGVLFKKPTAAQAAQPAPIPSVPIDLEDLPLAAQNSPASVAAPQEPIPAEVAAAEAAPDARVELDAPAEAAPEAMAQLDAAAPSAKAPPFPKDRPPLSPAPAAEPEQTPAPRGGGGARYDEMDLNELDALLDGMLASAPASGPVPAGMDNSPQNVPPLPGEAAAEGLRQELSPALFAELAALRQALEAKDTSLSSLRRELVVQLDTIHALQEEVAAQNEDTRTLRDDLEFLRRNLDTVAAEAAAKVIREEVAILLKSL